MSAIMTSMSRVALAGTKRARSLSSREGPDGDGSPKFPIRHPIQADVNMSDCQFCEATTCHCEFFHEVNEHLFTSLPRKRIISGDKRSMCAKSILPPFVTRLINILNVTKKDTFYDLGCGNGSVLFQVAYTTGAACVGVELCEHNAQLAREAWEFLRPQLEAQSGRKMPSVTIISGDLSHEIAKDAFLSPNTVVWTANLLMPKPVTHHMAERFRQLPVGARIACFDDLYPHSRAVARFRDPEAFRLFQMKDHIWTSGTVEWTNFEGPFFSYTRV